MKKWGQVQAPVWKNLKVKENWGLVASKLGILVEILEIKDF